MLGTPSPSQRPRAPSAPRHSEAINRRRANWKRRIARAENAARRSADNIRTNRQLQGGWPVRIHIKRVAPSPPRAVERLDARLCQPSRVETIGVGARLRHLDETAARGYLCRSWRAAVAASVELDRPQHVPHRGGHLREELAHLFGRQCHRNFLYLKRWRAMIAPPAPVQRKVTRKFV